MSSSMFAGYACVLLFLIVVEKINSEECGHSSYESNPDSSVVITEKGNAREGQWSWMVGITSRGSRGTSYEPHCSGLLIDRRHIISPAHCYENKEAELYRARIGNINQNEGDEYRISRIVVHAGYTPSMFYNDIAILTLEHEVNSSNVNPICLPDEEVSKMNLTDRRTVVAGWGTDGYNGDFDIYLKFRTGIRVMSNKQCEKRIQQGLQGRFRRQFPYGINKDFICTVLEEDGSDVCVRSGGALMIENGNRWFAVGVSSFGVKCGEPDGIPDGYVNIANYLDWIRRNTDCGVSRYENSPEEEMWPWMAAIRKRKKTNIYSFVCSGFLIDTRHLISTAHCFSYDDKDVGLYRVRIGHINQDEGDEYRISRIVVHSGYTKGEFYNDIAILTLDREVNSRNFYPICLPDEEVSKMNLIGKSTTEIGWGTDAPGGSEHGTFLKYLTGQVIMGNQQCEEIFRERINDSFQRTFTRGINKDILCATFGESGHGICISSGSPLMIQSRNRWFAVGVSSFGISCGRLGMPDGYTNVTNYVDWIMQNSSE